VSRTLWLLSFTDLAALLLAFFALVVSMQRFGEAPASGPTPVVPVAGEGAPVDAGSDPSPAPLSYRIALIRDLIARLSGPCRPAAIAARGNRLRAVWERGRWPATAACGEALAHALWPITSAADLPALVVEEAGADPAAAPWRSLEELARDLARRGVRVRLLVRRVGTGRLVLVVGDRLL